jgi:hypothetical protein
MIPIQDFRNFILVKVHEQNQSGIVKPGGQSTPALPSSRMLPGHELAQIKEHLDEIGGETGQKIQGWFSIMPKYAVLEMITNPNGELLKEFPAQIQGIVEKTAGMDYQLALGNQGE